MKEISQIISAYDQVNFKLQKCALATVVQVEGSSYRRPGARMLITDDGKLTGAISGGCLEGDALRKALLVIHKGEAMVVTYDTMDEDDAKLGVGLGCNGIIHVLIEPLLPDDAHNPVQLLKMLVSKRQNGVLVTLFSLENKTAAPAGTCALYTSGGNTYSRVTDPALSQCLAAEAAEAFRYGHSIYRSILPGNQLNGFIELIVPPIAVVIIGAGNDVVPLTALAHVMGWAITVVDGRASHATPERFPLAGKVIISKPGAILSQVIPDAQTCFLLMTHNYNYDLEALRVLLETGTKYIGVLGPKKKMQKMEREPDLAVRPQFGVVYGPVGLDIGAETPEEIALSIVAEIKAVFAGREGASLRNLPEAIHFKQLG